jgi:hypothetical protein
LRLIGVHLKQMGDRENLNALRRGLRTGAAPLTVAVKDAAREKLPHAGGLNELVADRRVTVSTRMSAKTASVALRTTNSRGNAQTDAGYVRHPTPSMLGYDRSYWHWVEQEIPNAKGWWTDTLQHESPTVTPVLEAELLAAAAKLGLR